MSRFLKAVSEQPTCRRGGQQMSFLAGCRHILVPWYAWFCAHCGLGARDD